MIFFLFFFFPLNFKGLLSSQGQPESQHESPEGMLLWPCWGKPNKMYLPKNWTFVQYHCFAKDPRISLMILFREKKI